MESTMENLKRFLDRVENSSKLKACYINCNSADEFIAHRGSIVHIEYIKTKVVLMEITTLSTDTPEANSYCFVVSLGGNGNEPVFFKLTVVRGTKQTIATCLNGAIDTLKQYPEYYEYATTLEELL